MLGLYLELAPRLYSAATALFEPKTASAKRSTVDPSTKALVENLRLTRSPANAFLESISYHTKTIYIFAYSDLKTVLIPWTVFGLAHAFAAPLFNLPYPSAHLILLRTPLAALWIALNILPFTVGNQRHPIAVLEDSINKPWRPLPSKRISSKGAKDLMIGTYLFAYLVAHLLGGASQCLLLAILGYIHNDLGGGDRSWVIRGALNGVAFVSFGSGATEVMIGHKMRYSPVLIDWLKIVSVVVFSGMHVQDLRDQEGDKLVGRVTLPLVIGDMPARWTVVASALLSSFIVPFWWTIGAEGYFLPMIGALYVSWRVLTKKKVEDDRETFKMWNLWLVSIYCLPLVKYLLENKLVIRSIGRQSW
ncbi:hypothetical protein H2198_000883 [Neophaeococcomyces mojaviensis]|uniref:Uncharacterized protein n=1 Tax=Neophaeococcomyces mojaviensis TaxID=3383035 RepID=A0ACC3AJ83_9EURO|nr:hypothetical protein H2198_000883 [Knufia sp. JES_112]